METAIAIISINKKILFKEVTCSRFFGSFFFCVDKSGELLYNVNCENVSQFRTEIVLNKQIVAKPPGGLCVVLP